MSHLSSIRTPPPPFPPSEETLCGAACAWCSLTLLGICRRLKPQRSRPSVTRAKRAWKSCSGGLIHELARSLDESELAEKLTSQGFPTVPALACAPDGSIVAQVCNLDPDFDEFFVIKASQEQGATVLRPSRCGASVLVCAAMRCCVWARR